MVAVQPLINRPFCPDNAILAGFSGSLAPCPLSKHSERYGKNLSSQLRHKGNIPEIIRSYIEQNIHKRRLEPTRPSQVCGYLCYYPSIAFRRDQQNTSARPMSSEHGEQTAVALYRLSHVGHTQGIPCGGKVVGD